MILISYPAKSAYAIGVDRGFVGTEDEWLATLKGPPGPPGGVGSLPDDVARLALVGDDVLITTADETLSTKVPYTPP